MKNKKELMIRKRINDIKNQDKIRIKNNYEIKNREIIENKKTTPYIKSRL